MRIKTDAYEKPPSERMRFFVCFYKIRGDTYSVLVTCCESGSVAAGNESHVRSNGERSSALIGTAIERTAGNRTGRSAKEKAPCIWHGA